MNFLHEIKNRSAILTRGTCRFDPFSSPLSFWPVVAYLDLLISCCLIAFVQTPWLWPSAVPKRLESLLVWRIFRPFASDTLNNFQHDTPAVDAPLQSSTIPMAKGDLAWKFPRIIWTHIDRKNSHQYKLHRESLCHVKL